MTKKIAILLVGLFLFSACATSIKKRAIKRENSGKYPQAIAYYAAAYGLQQISRQQFVANLDRMKRKIGKALFCSHFLTAYKHINLWIDFTPRRIRVKAMAIMQGVSGTLGCGALPVIQAK